MTCVPCNEQKFQRDKTLYDKTVARRVAGASRRTKRSLASLAVLGLFAAGGAAGLQPATAAPDFAGFTTFAQATPLRVEIFEPAIPVPSSPQVEFNFSYTKVNGASGPIGTARASAMWPGDAIGEGLKTFGEQLGLPGQLTDGGYPAQVNAQTPGETATASQEFLPGSVGRVSTNEKKAVAKVGYGTTGDVTEGGSAEGAAPPNLLDLLMDPTGLADVLLGTVNGQPGDQAPSASPLGALGVIVAAGGMESVSSTTYDAEADEVVATATARLGSVALLAGLVKLDGVEVVTRTTSNIAGGAKTTKNVTIGAMSVAGNKFGYTGTGFEAMGQENPLPGLPDDPVQALAALGIKIELGKSVMTKEGPAGASSAEALRISIDTAPLLDRLPKLPLSDLVANLPDLPGQAAILKGLIVALGEATPRIDLVLGQAITNAQTVKAIDIPTTPTTPLTPGATPGEVPGLLSVDESGSLPVGGPAVTPPVTDPVVTPQPVAAATSALPALGSIPMALLVGGLLLAAGLGWYITNAGNVLFGGAAACAHGLKAGIPDLRKV